jgi:UDP-N-acetylmuramyl tripeptide synthase
MRRRWINRVQLISLFDRFLCRFTPVPDVTVTAYLDPGACSLVIYSLHVGHTYGWAPVHPGPVAKGAAAVIGVESIESLPVPYIQVSNSRQALAHLSAAWYGFPAQKLVVLGVTGTDGKTTTTNLIFQILKAAGIQAGMISTVSAVIGDHELDTGFHVTTPDAPDVQRLLAEMVDNGLTNVVIEATSHGLAQYRVDACNFSVAAVTNITQSIFMAL